MIFGSLFSRRTAPERPLVINIIFQGKDDAMPVSQDVQDFCSSIGPAVQSYAGQKVADVQTRLDAANAQLAQVQQDHADEVSALKSALAAATMPLAAPQGDPNAQA